MAIEESAGNKSSIRLSLSGVGRAHAETGVPVLDRLLEQFAAYGRFELTLGVGPGSTDTQVAASGQALGSALAPLLRDGGAQGHGSAHVPSAEALAHVALDLSEAPCLVTNFDLSAAHVGGMAGDLVDRFLTELALAAGITLHVRLVEGRDTQHVLDAIFKALGVALEAACRVRGDSR